MDEEHIARFRKHMSGREKGDGGDMSYEEYSTLLKANEERELLE